MPPTHRCKPAGRRLPESRLAPAAGADPRGSYHGYDSPLHPATDASRPSSPIPSTPPCRVLHADLIGLHVDQIELSLLDDGLMHSLTLQARTVAPRRDRAFIQTIGLHNCLHRASKCQKDHDNDHHIRRGAYSFKHRASTNTEGVFAHLTAIALPLAIMDRDIAQTSLASCATRQIRAKLL